MLVCHTYQRPPFTHSPTWLQKIWEGNGKCRGCLYRCKSHLSDVVAQREAKGILCRPACAMRVQSVADKQRARAQKSDFKRGNWGQGLEPFCSESDYSALVRRQERRKIQISARENTSTGFTINAPTVDHNRNIFTPSDCASFTRSPSLPRLLMETRFWICNVTGYSC